MKKTIIDAFNYRYACKKFDNNKKISREDFEFILETGRLSPSSFGLEPWQFVVIEDENLKVALDEVVEGSREQIQTSSHVLVILSRNGKEMKAGSDYIKNIFENVMELPEEINEMMTNFYSFFQNENDLSDERKILDWAKKQTYIAMGNMMTSAAMIGIDSCPIEGFTPSKVDKVLEDFDVLDKNAYTVSVIVPFGYRDESTLNRPKKRRTTEEVVKWV